MSEKTTVTVTFTGIIELGFFLFLSTWIVVYSWSPRCAVESPYETSVQP